MPTQRQPFLESTLSLVFRQRMVDPAKIDAFEARLKTLRPMESYPCPWCFVRGEEQPLFLRPAGGGWVDQATCPKCKTSWSVPMPKA
jgi:hypothetical protein